MPNRYEFDIQGEKVHIGEEGNKFVPKLRFNRWNLESFVELNLIGGGNATRFNTSTLNPDGSITAENRYLALTYKQVDVNPPFNDIGGVDFTLLVKQNFGVSTIGFTYNHQACNATTQLPLTAQFSNGWNDELQCNIVVTETEVKNESTQELLFIRPDYVVNSIAFYHDSKMDNSYKTGKIGHLYRMRVIDAELNETWADWGLGGGQSQITLTIDANWLDNAVYPVTIQPVGDAFGYISAGGSERGLSDDDYHGFYTYSPSSDGTLVSITTYSRYTTTGGSVEYALYTAVADAVYVDDCEAVSLPAAIAWNPSDVNVGESVSSLTGYMFVYCHSAVTMYIGYDDNASSGKYRGFKNGNFYGDPWPDPLTAVYGDGYDADRQHSMYANYTPSGGGWSNIAKVGGVTATDLAKVDGIAVADIAKICGVAV